MWRVSKRRWTTVAIVAVLAAAAVVIPIASSAGDTTPGNLLRARSEASRLLGLLHVPPGAVQHSSAPAFGGRRGVLGSPGYDEATPNLVDAHHFWTVRGSASRVLAYVAAHRPWGSKWFTSGSGSPPPGYHMTAFSLPPIPGVLAERVVAVSVVQLNSTTTVMRTDGEAVWVTPRPASEKVPAGVQEIDVSSTAFMSGARVLAVSVTDPAQVQRIVGWINAMGLAQPGSFNCPSLNGPTVTFVFRAAGGKVLARASGMDFDGSADECSAIALSIGGRSQPPLVGANFYARVQRLLGVRFDKGAMSSRHLAVLDVLGGDGIDGVHFGASPTVVQHALDSLLQQNGTGYQRGGSCQLDHQIKWRDQWTTSGEPALTTYFSHGAFAGYQVGDVVGPSVLRHQRGGWSLATSRGLRIGDTLAHGRGLYGQALALSYAQGGSWNLRTAAGVIDGYAWGMSKHADVSWHSAVATIDAGDVGCPAMSP